MIHIVNKFWLIGLGLELAWIGIGMSWAWSSDSHNYIQNYIDTMCLEMFNRIFFLKSGFKSCNHKKHILPSFFSQGLWFKQQAAGVSRAQCQFSSMEHSVWRHALFLRNKHSLYQSWRLPCSPAKGKNWKKGCSITLAVWQRGKLKIAFCVFWPFVVTTHR